MVRAGDLVVTGVPGDVGVLEVVPLQQQQQQQQQQQAGGRQAVTLESFVMVKQVGAGGIEGTSAGDSGQGWHQGRCSWMSGR